MDCGLRPADCGLGIKYGLGRKRGLGVKHGLGIKHELQASDWV